MPDTELLQGTLDLLILKVLTVGPLHGYAIARSIRESSGDTLLVKEGSLYPALYRMERRGWIRAHWGVSENGRRARYYRLTAAANRQLETEEEQWKRYTKAVARVLATAGKGAA
jgi:PadR family transcriptional regulator, regulatory protein PadR